MCGLENVQHRCCGAYSQEVRYECQRAAPYGGWIHCAYRDAQGARAVDTPCTSCSQRGRPSERKDSFHPFRSLGGRTPTP
ncbi:hypothetical protein MCOR27_004834 [Pyricularia oryzae]|nr:hypothetical protein MCOR19_003751 [Pyricularia oryzae]KAI6280156.1 hypothetical protein MCOR27_004834 [Pyricularia oryzae]KAI6283574.1 hypothetical protein MCOR26_002395 [Pyricularia oryzae]KAI6420324.1 hypothetical protein MCOR21_009790 [Pyricularia oryzae]KAI6443991.1 hypothetical protein MCOR22_005083 [Pyricularia oryzae]